MITRTKNEPYAATALVFGCHARRMLVAGGWLCWPGRQEKSERLQGRSDAVLEAGNLPRSELEAGLAELKARKAAGRR
jgi:hypothetical protein